MNCYDAGVPNTCFQQELSLVKMMMRYLPDDATVVEFGPLFGGSTKAMLEGLNGKGMVYSFDTFKYSAWMDRMSTYGLKPGDCFQHVTQDNLKLYGNVTLCKCDLMQVQPWHKPIDFMFVDAMKTIWVAEPTMKTFLPRLKVGGYVFDQDIGYNPVQFTCMLTLYYQLRDYLKPHTMPIPGTGILFQCVQPIPLLDDIIPHEFRVSSKVVIEALQYFHDLGIFNKDRESDNFGKAKGGTVNAPENR